MKKFNFKWLLLSIILSIVSINTAWADETPKRTFESGQKIYFKDASGNISGLNCLWKVSSGNVYAYFYDDAATPNSAWASSYGDMVHGSWNAANAVYEFTVPKLNSADHTWTGVIFTRGTAATWGDGYYGQQTSDQTPDIGQNMFIMSTAAAVDGKYNGSWDKFAKTPSLIGSFNDWDPDQGYFTDGRIILELEGSANHTFKVLVNDAYCGVGSGTITNTTSSWWHLDGGNDVGLITGEAGEYCFHWNSETYYIGVYYPQARFAASQYIYFNVEGETGWKSLGDKVMFWTKYYDSGDNNPDGGLSCNTPVETYVYYAQIPNNDYIGQVQLNRYDGSSWKASSAIAYAYNRTSSSQNCMIEESGKESAAGDGDWTPQWTTYCPPTKEETLSDNGSSIVPGTSGTGTSGNPILVIKGTKLKVTASANKSVADGNMTIKYDFKVNKTSQQDGTSGSYSSYTASTNNAIYKVSVDAYTNYKLDDTKNSTKHTPDTLYYKALNEYTIKYYGGTNAESGSHADDKQYHGIAKTLPGATFTCANYTQTGWTTSDGGAKVYDLSTAYTANTNLNLYPVWTEVPYDITATAGEGGSVGSASYTGKVVTTCAISATPNTGYKFSHWSVESGSATFDDQYSASTTMNATSDAKIKANFVYRWSIAGTWKIITPGEGDPYWDQDNYAMGNIGTNASSKDTCYVEITLPANTNYTFKVVDRSTSPYTWLCNNTATYYMTYGNSSNWTFKNDKDNTAACGITTAGAGTYKFAYNITDSKVTVTYPNSYTVTFGYGTGGSAVTATVEDATTISSGQYATAGKDITFTKTAANLAYTFKGWYNASSDGGDISCMASDDVYDDIAGNISVYAQFKTRYGLHGSLMDNNAGGMPGWAGDGADFTVVSYTDIGEGTGKGVDLECSRTLEPNKQYKFRVQDRAAGSRWGLSESAVLPAEVPVNNVKLSTYGDVYSKDVYINTVGYGTYTFKITNMYDNEDGKYYPAIEVSRPASSLLTLGRKHYTNGTLSDGNTGGTVTAATNEGSGYDITNGQFYANGSNLTFTASPATGYHVEGWYSDANCSFEYTSGEGGATISGEGNVTLALASVSTNKTVYVKFTEDTKEAASGDGDWSAKVGDSKITDVVTISSTITVDVDHALAKRVILDQSGGKAGKLVITANKGLEVAEGIWVNKGSDPVAPTAEDLVLESSASGNATLIFNNSNSAAATVQMYSKSVIAGENTWNWQYIGSPYVSASALHNYYGCYLKKWGDPAVGWNDVANGASVEPWKAYSVTQESTSTFVMEGTLVPTDNIVELDIPDKPSWIVANSWTAPIYIDAMDGAFDEETEKTVYLFNTGFAPNGAGTATTGTEESRYAAGTYLSVPVNSAVSMGNPFISSMQGFVVKNTTDPRKAIKLTLNYSTMVRPTIDRGIAGGKMHAPKNIQEDEQPTVLKMLARGTNYDDCLYLLERADFTTGFDNGWDGSKLGDNAVAPRLYTTREDGTKESVSAVPELEGSILTFRAGEDNVYTFQFEYSEETETLYLLDLDKNIYTRVLTGSTYTFTTNDKAEHPRFILTRYGAPQITTGVDEVYNANSARKQMINGTLYIIRDGRIYNAEGTLVK